MAVTFCPECGFGAENALHCSLCGADFSGKPRPESASQISWVEDATQAQQRAPGHHGPVVYAPGRVFAGRYKIVDLVGKGAMGVVLKAVDQQTKRTVALKLSQGDANDSQLMSRFRREVKIASELQHPNALEVFDAGVVSSTCYYAMELVDGGSVADLLESVRTLPFERVDAIAQQLVSVVAAAHAKGVVHRDIKPSNVLLTRDGTAKLVDFGIAKLHESAGGTALTRTGMMTGTALYVAPEQAKDSKNVDGRADLYSIGVMLFEMIAGHPPFRGNTPMEVLIKHASDPPPALSASRPDVPPALERVVLRCLAKDPAERFQSAAELLEALRGVNAQATREKMPNGDLVVLHRPSARYPLEIHTHDAGGHFPERQRILFDGRSYRLAEKGEGRPPFKHSLKFELQVDYDSTGTLIDYRALAELVPAEGLFGMLARKLRGD